MITSPVTHADIARYEYLLGFKFYCDRPECDGEPHRMMPHRHARAAQHPPAGDWDVWALISGRGFGKTRSGAEFLSHRIQNWKGSKATNRGIIVAPTLAVARDVCVDGESGIIAHTPADRIKGFNRQSMELIFVNGGRVKLFGADNLDDADRIRGYQSHVAWFEELATQRYQTEAWDNAAFANRLGEHPRTVVTATPRPTRLVKKLLKDPEVVLTTGSTYDNFRNLPDAFIKRVRKNYEGTRLERQELFGELISDQVGALWTRADIDYVTTHPTLVRVVVGVDPAGTTNHTNAMTGIVVVGLAADGKCYVLEDLSGWHEPEVWAKTVCEAAERWDAKPVVESNFGADLVIAALRVADRSLAARTITLNATKGKMLRADPVVSLYKQGEVLHVGVFADLEDQQTSWVPPGQFERDADDEPVAIPPSGYSPDRVDALVWAVTELRNLAGKHVPRVRARFTR
jgi:phage terminase large subunit-like protein